MSSAVTDIRITEVKGQYEKFKYAIEGEESIGATVHNTLVLIQASEGVRSSKAFPWSPAAFVLYHLRWRFIPQYLN